MKKVFQVKKNTLFLMENILFLDGKRVLTNKEFIRLFYKLK